MSADNIRINIQLTPKDATVGALLDALLEKYVETYNKNHSEQIHRIIVNDSVIYDINIKNCDDMFLVRTPKVRGKSNVDKN